MKLLVDGEHVTITSQRRLVNVPRFVEWDRHTFELRPDQQVEAEFEVGGRLVEPIRDYRNPIVIRWHWGPDVVRDRIGYVTCRLWVDGQLMVDTELLIEPIKMSLDDYQTMMAETRALAYNLFYDLRFTTYEHLDLCVRDFPKSDLEYLEIIDKLADELTLVVSRIARAPNRRLRSQLETRYLWEARRLSTGSPRWLATEGITSLQLAPTTVGLAVVQHLRGHLPTTLQVEESIVDYDVHENRAIKYLVDLMSSRLRRISHRKLGDEEHHALALCQRKVAALAETPFLSHAGELRTHVRYTVVFEREPNYHQFYQLYRGYHWQLAFDPEEALANPHTLTMQELWRAYEIWCYFKVVDMLKMITVGQALDQRDVFTILNFNQAVPRLGDDSTINLQTGEGGRLSVTYHRTFRPLSSNRSDLVISVSSKKVPDIVVESEKGELMLLDAKYKLDSEDAEDEVSQSVRGRPVQGDIDTMHVYRDAIRRQDDVRAADWAFILYPGTETVRQDQDRLGAIPLQPKDDNALREVLSWWVDQTCR